MMNSVLSWRFVLLVSPIFFLTVKHGTNLIVMISFLLSLNYLIQTRSKTKNFSHSAKSLLRSDYWVIAALSMPLLAVLIAQVLRSDFYPPNFDAPLRLLLCVPIYMALKKGWLANANDGRDSFTVQWTLTVLPIALIVTYPVFHFSSSAFGHQRGTYFVDPLTFGSYTLLFSLLSLAALTYFWSEISTARRLLSLLGIVVGVYMSVTTNSRSGWINLPVFTFLWIFLLLKPKWGLAKSLIPLIGILIVTGLILWWKPGLIDKFAQAISEIRTYKWNDSNPDTSVGLRISFYRLAYFYFLQSPIAGWGDLGWMKLMNTPELTVYASEFARSSAKEGFHNEILTSTVRSGVWGLISSLSLFLVFAIQAIKGLMNRHANSFFVSFCMLVVVVHLFATGLTTEVTNLVFLCSFIGLTLSCMASEQQNENQAMT